MVSRRGPPQKPKRDVREAKSDLSLPALNLMRGLPFRRTLRCDVVSNKVRLPWSRSVHLSFVLLLNSVGATVVERGPGPAFTANDGEVLQGLWARA